MNSVVICTLYIEVAAIYYYLKNKNSLKYDGRERERPCTEASI